MNFEQKIKAEAAEAAEKMAKIKKWPARLQKIASRKTDPLREAAFCRKHEINIYRFNRYKNMKEKSLPSDAFMASVDAAFKAEKA